MVQEEITTTEQDLGIIAIPLKAPGDSIQHRTPWPRPAPLGKTPIRYMTLNYSIPDVNFTARDDIDFLAKSIVISNYTGYWLWSGVLGLYVCPRLVAFIYNFPSGFQVLDWRVQIPVTNSGQGSITAHQDTNVAPLIVTLWSRQQMPSAGIKLIASASGV